MPNGVKWKIGWGYTAKCNMSCPFCYSRIARQVDEEIPLEAAKRFLSGNAAMIESINYGTGECVLSPNWAVLCAHIRSAYPEIRQALTTNGSIAHQIKCGRIDGRQFAAMIDEVDVSLDFPVASLHNRTRGNENAYRWVLETLDYCNTNAIIPTIVMVAYKETLEAHNLDGIFALAEQYKAFVRINILRPLRGTTTPPPANRDLHRALCFLLQGYKVVSLCDPLIGPLYGAAQPMEPEKPHSLRILPNGGITPSTYLIEKQWQAENIRNEVSLPRLLGTDVFTRVQDAPIPAECRSCVYEKSCRGGAIDRRILHYGSLSERDPYCPFREGLGMPERPPVAYSDRKHNSPTIHDGYLPTLIFDF